MTKRSMVTRSDVLNAARERWGDGCELREDRTALVGEKRKRVRAEMLAASQLVRSLREKLEAFDRENRDPFLALTVAARRLLMGVAAGGAPQDDYMRLESACAACEQRTQLVHEIRAAEEQSRLARPSLIRERFEVVRSLGCGTEILAGGDTLAALLERVTRKS